MTKLPERLWQLRAGRGITQKRLASILHLSPSAISNYENGIHMPNYDILSRIAEFYGVSPDYLLGGTDYPRPTEGKSGVIHGDCTLGQLQALLAYLDEGDRAYLAHHIRILEELRMPRR